MTDDTSTTESTTTDHATVGELAERLQHGSVELTMNDPASDHANLVKGGDALRDARIISLREATCETRGLFQFKRRIVQDSYNKQGVPVNIQILFSVYNND